MSIVYSVIPIMQLTSNFLGLIENLKSSTSHCGDFLINYSLAHVITLIASLCTVALNFALKAIVTPLVKKECHGTTTEHQRDAFVKIFSSLYINMTVAALLAYGYVQDKPAMAKNVSAYILKNHEGAELTRIAGVYSRWAIC